jgi:hypothetical protein
MSDWTLRRIALLRSWERHAKTQRHMHLLASDIYHTWWLRLGVPATVCGFIGGPGSLVSALTTSVYESWSLLFHTLATIGGVLTPVMVFLSLETKDKGHENTGVAWGKVARIIHLECDQEVHAESFVSFQKRISDEFSDIESLSIRLPLSVEILEREIMQSMFEADTEMAHIDHEMLKVIKAS